MECGWVEGEEQSGDKTHNSVNFNKHLNAAFSSQIKHHKDIKV